MKITISGTPGSGKTTVGKILSKKLKLKDKDAAVGVFKGIRMKCQGYKTRFTKPFQNVTIEVPYDEGMDPYSGLLDVCINMGLVKRGGAWYTSVATGQKFQKTDFTEYAGDLLIEAEKQTHAILSISEDVKEDVSEEESMVSRRKKKATE